MHMGECLFVDIDAAASVINETGKATHAANDHVADQCKMLQSGLSEVPVYTGAVLCDVYFVSMLQQIAIDSVYSCGCVTAVTVSAHTSCKPAERTAPW